jgi:dTDP-4-dehydrorhamnose reductase
MKLLITGAGGMTGSELVRQAAERSWDVVALSRADLDITDADAVEGVIGHARPDVIINAAAYTAVDAAEQDVERAMAVNAAGAQNVARAAKVNASQILHISTDYVFDGEGTEPYQPDDRTAPINVYGESKLAGEIAIRDACPEHVIVRTSWVYSHEGKNFLRTMLRLAEEKPEIKVVNDQHGCPTSSQDLAHALLCAANLMMRSYVSGTYHFCNAGETTWFEFAKAIFDERESVSATVLPILTSEYPTPAKRPRWSVLDTGSFQLAFGVEPRPWREAMKETMERIS